MECSNCGHEVPSKADSILNGVFWTILIIGAFTVPVVFMVLKSTE